MWFEGLRKLRGKKGEREVCIGVKRDRGKSWCVWRKKKLRSNVGYGIGRRKDVENGGWVGDER